MSGRGSEQEKGWGLGGVTAIPRPWATRCAVILPEAYRLRVASVVFTTSSPSNDRSGLKSVLVGSLHVRN